MTISDEDQKLVREMVGKLLEHYDSVQIFVTRQNGEKQVTESFETGGGNFFAHMGQIHEWCSIQDQFQREYARKKDSEE